MRNSAAVTVATRRSVNISCISYGVPVPTITWRFNNQPVPYTQTDTFTNYSVDVTGNITQGNVVSTLHIVNAQTTEEYVCMGSNTYNGVTTNSYAMITVQVLGQLTSSSLWSAVACYCMPMPNIRYPIGRDLLSWCAVQWSGSEHTGGLCGLALLSSQL